MWWRRNPTTERDSWRLRRTDFVIVGLRYHGNLLFEAPQFYGYVTKVCGFHDLTQVNSVSQRGLAELYLCIHVI